MQPSPLIPAPSGIRRGLVFVHGVGDIPRAAPCWTMFSLSSTGSATGIRREGSRRRDCMTWSLNSQTRTSGTPRHPRERPSDSPTAMSGCVSKPGGRGVIVNIPPTELMGFTLRATRIESVRSCCAASESAALSPLVCKGGQLRVIGRPESRRYRGTAIISCAEWMGSSCDLGEGLWQCLGPGDFIRGSLGR
jgi:hypothetical protein